MSYGVKVHRRHASTHPRRKAVYLLAAVLPVATTAAIAFALVTSGFGSSAAPTAGPTPGPSPSFEPTNVPQPQEPTPAVTEAALPDATFTILAAGDVLPHIPVLTSARKGGEYNFAPLLAGMSPWVQGADLALCHFEVPVTPAGLAPTGYPLFGTVPQLVTGLAQEGWDGCSTASNHSIDRGFAGVAATLDAFDAANLGHAGTARTETESLQPQLFTLERGGQLITVAQISATYGTNGLPLPAAQPWSVELIDPATNNPTDPSRIIEQARAARAAGANLVVVSLHAGVEYHPDPTPEQVALAAALAESGQVDLIIGHHAHVPQPIELLPGGTDGAGMWVAYGLGNMLSNQDSACCAPATAAGVVLIANIVKPADGPARVASVEWTAVSGDRLAGHVLHILPEVAAIPGKTGTLTQAQWQTRYDAVRSAVGVQAPEATRPPIATGPAPTVVPRTP